MKKLIVGLMAFMMFASSAMGAIHLEPYVGYADGEEDVSSGTPDSYSGIGFGARIGYNYLGLMVGGTYDTIGITAEPASGTTDYEIDYTNMGAYLGYEFPIGLRIWLSYYLDAKAEFGGNSGIDGAELSGTGTSFGLGYSVIPMVLSLNAELKTYSYDELTSATGTVTQLNNSGSSYFFLSVSAPLSF